MAAASYPIRRVRPLRRGLRFFEFILAVSILGGLVWVTIKIRNLETAEAHQRPAMTGTGMVNTGTGLAAPRGDGGKTH